MFTGINNNTTVMIKNIKDSFEDNLESNWYEKVFSFDAMDLKENLIRGIFMVLVLKNRQKFNNKQLNLFLWEEM